MHLQQTAFENIVTKVDIGHREHYLLLLQCFLYYFEIFRKNKPTVSSFSHIQTLCDTSAADESLESLWGRKKLLSIFIFYGFSTSCGIRKGEKCQIKILYATCISAVMLIYTQIIPKETFYYIEMSVYHPQNVLNI